MKIQRSKKQNKKKKYGSTKIPMYHITGPWHRLYWKIEPEKAVHLYMLRIGLL